MSKANSLGPIDWIKASFRALTEHGPEAVRVEKLARELGVTKGSFYWHFADLPALQTAMLEHWRDVATETIIHRSEESDAPIATILENLLMEAVSNPATDYGGPQAESAIRGWARSHTTAAETVRQVDRRRLGFLERKLKATGVKPRAAKQCAALYYSTLIGAEQLSETAPLTRKSIQSYVSFLLRGAGTGKSQGE